MFVSTDPHETDQFHMFIVIRARWIVSRHLTKLIRTALIVCMCYSSTDCWNVFATIDPWPTDRAHMFVHPDAYIVFGPYTFVHC